MQLSRIHWIHGGLIKLFHCIISYLCSLKLKAHTSLFILIVSCTAVLPLTTHNNLVVTHLTDYIFQNMFWYLQLYWSFLLRGKLRTRRESCCSADLLRGKKVGDGHWLILQWLLLLLDDDLISCDPGIFCVFIRRSITTSNDSGAITMPNDCCAITFHVFNFCYHY